MSRVFRNPNPYSKTLTKKFNSQIFFILTVVCAAALAFFISQQPTLLNIFFAVVGFCIFLFTVWQVLKDVAKKDRGDRAEERVAKYLQELPYEYAVFLNVPVRRLGDIDIVLVGPTGVFAIEVKSHRWLPKWGKDFRIQVKNAATELKKYLSKNGQKVFVPGLLVFTGATGNRFFNQGKGIFIMSLDGLKEYLSRAQRVEYDRLMVEDLVQRLYKE